MQTIGRRRTLRAICLIFLTMIPSAPRLVANDPPSHTAPALNPKPALQLPNHSTLVNSGSSNSTLAWSIDPPISTWNLTHNEGIEFVVTIGGDAAIKKLRVTHSSLVDSDSNRAIAIPATAFHICHTADEPVQGCDGSLRAPDQAPSTTGAATSVQPKPFKNTLWLKVDPDKVPDGVFTGTLTLDTEEATDSKTLSLTLQRTSRSAQGRGLALLVAGIVLAWFVTVFARSRINREQALLPVALLSQKLDSLRSKLALLTAFATDVKLTRSAIESVAQELTIVNLDAKQLLPPRIPGLAQPGNTQLTAYQDFLQRKSQIVENLDVIVVGIESGAAVLPATPQPGIGDLHALVSKIDAFSGTLPQDSNVLRTQIKTVIDNYSSGPGPRMLGFAAQPTTHPFDRPVALSVVSISLQIQTIGLLFWAVWGTLSVIIGFTVLINSSPGFGLFTDYIRCFLWGFGLPVAGQGLQQLTMSSVNSQLGINLPK